jgi:aryl-alcohol dehydrogenase-like predicted oxidoreductase
MEYRRLGRTGLKVAPLCLGGNVFGGIADQPTSHAVLDAYAEGGGNFIDTADVYSRKGPENIGGESERVLGRWIVDRGNRAHMIIATKAAGSMGAGPNDTGLSRRHIMAAVEGSLRRLGTEYIDLYQAHWDDVDTPQDETLRAFDDLVHQGKVLYVGASNYSAWRLTRALWLSDRGRYARYECLQPHYNLVHRAEYERELEPLIRDQDLGVIPYSSLASGFLTGKYRRGQPLPVTPRAEGVAKRHMSDRGFAILEAVDRVVSAHGATPSQVALAWLIARPGITAPIASATSVDQMRELLGAVELRLEPSDVEALDAASEWREKN